MQQGSDAWLDLRSKHAITWSEAANAVGIGYDSPKQYMKRKLGMTPSKESNWRMTEGQKREPWAAEIYYQLMNHHFDMPVKLYTDSFRSDWQDKRLGGSVDRICRNEQGEEWILEIKTTPGSPVMRDEIPISHLLQMHGLCHTYKVQKAHYFCWTASVGILMAEVMFADELWDEILYPRYKSFADMWALRTLPARNTMSKDDKEEFIEDIRACCSIEPVFIEPSQVEQLPTPPQTPASTPCCQYSPPSSDRDCSSSQAESWSPE